MTGPLDAGLTMRTPIPNLTCDVHPMIVAGDRVVTHLHFRGTYTGVFEGVQGIDFVATDVYRVTNGRIAENWHIPDTGPANGFVGLTDESRCRHHHRREP